MLSEGGPILYEARKRKAMDLRAQDELVKHLTCFPQVAKPQGRDLSGSWWEVGIEDVLPSGKRLHFARITMFFMGKSTN